MGWEGWSGAGSRVAVGVGSGRWRVGVCGWSDRREGMEGDGGEEGSGVGRVGEGGGSGRGGSGGPGVGGPGVVAALWRRSG